MRGPSDLDQPTSALRILVAKGASDPSLTQALGRLPEDGVLELHLGPEPAGDLPRQLLARGFQLQAEEPEILRISRRPVRPLEDLSELPPPEPFERVLNALLGLRPKELYLARLPRYPRMLVPQLEARGVDFALAMRPDGTALLWIRGR